MRREIFQPGSDGRFEDVTLHYVGERRETYQWRDDGQLASVQIADTGYDDDGFSNPTSTGQFTRAAGSAAFTYDTVGRQIRQVDYSATGTPVYDRELTYDAGGRDLVTYETTYTRQGADTITTATENTYGVGTADYALGQVLGSTTATTRNDLGQGSSTTTNAYAWGQGAQLSSSTITQSGQSQAQTFAYAYGQDGRLDRVDVSDARPRTVTITSDLSGEAIRRSEVDYNAQESDPHDVWYRFAGREMGRAGNISNRASDYSDSIAKRGTAQGNWVFANASQRQTWRFSEAVAPITSYDQGGDGGSYTIRGGETLSGIAAQLWGDGGLWYKLASANGLTGSSSLTAGQVLRVPAGVTRDTSNAATLETFDPADALGDLNPIDPTPTAKKSRRNKCGVFGQVLLVVVAVAVTVATKGALAKFAGSALGLGMGTTGAAVAGGALAGAAGSLASQGVGLATGLQDRFSFKGAALAALGGAVGGGLGAKLSGGGALGGIGRGVLGSVGTQGLGVATGLQSRLDWAGVATAGVIGGVSSWVEGLPGLTGFGQDFGSAAAGGLAGAAARSLATGTSFGDNLVAALPDIVGATVGNSLSDLLAPRETSMARLRRKNGIEYAENGRTGPRDVASDTVAPPIVVTASPDEVAKAKGWVWRLADKLGLHKGGVIYDLLHGGPALDLGTLTRGVTAAVRSATASPRSGFVVDLGLIRASYAPDQGLGFRSVAFSAGPGGNDVSVRAGGGRLRATGSPLGVGGEGFYLDAKPGAIWLQAGDLKLEASTRSLAISVSGVGILAPEITVAAGIEGGVYVLRDFDGNVMRSGRTKNLLSRRADHLRDPLLKDYDFDPIYRTDVYAEQRGLEQILHETYHPPLNKIQPISPNNPNRQTYMGAAQQYLEGIK